MTSLRAAPGRVGRFCLFLLFDPYLTVGTIVILLGLWAIGAEPWRED